MLRTATIQADDSGWPVVRVRFLGNLAEADFLQYLAYLDAALARAVEQQQPNAFLFDARDVGNVPARIRRMQADWMARNAAACRAHSLGYAFVIESTLVRGLMTAILWLSPMPAPHEVVGSVAEAESWLGARFLEDRRTTL